MQISILNKINSRSLFLAIFLICFFAVGYAMYAQFYQNADPCPLCIAQRVIFTGIALVSLIAFIHGAKKTGTLVYSVLVIALAIFGIKTAYHHVWLQSLPPSEWPASCGMPLSILYKQIPLSGFLHTVLSGSAECAMVSWKVLGISGAKLSLYGFSLILIICLFCVAKSFCKKNHETYI